MIDHLNSCHRLVCFTCVFVNMEGGTIAILTTLSFQRCSHCECTKSKALPAFQQSELCSFCMIRMFTIEAACAGRKENNNRIEAL